MEKAIYTETEKKVIGGDKPLVVLKTCLPKVGEKAPFAKSFGAYYKALSEGFEQYCGGALAKEAKNAATAEDFKPYGAVLNTVIAMESKSLVSLYVDAVLSAGDKRRIHRIPQLWHKETGTLVKADRLFVKGFVKKLLPLLKDCLEEYSRKTASPLFSDWEKLLKKRFNKEQFYLSPKGISFYYRSGELSALQKPMPLHLPMESLMHLISPRMAKLLPTEE